MPDRRPEFESETAPRLTGTLDGKYNYVPLGSRKPCLYVKSWWPNLDWRMYNSNSLAFIADFLVSSELSRTPRYYSVSHFIFLFVSFRMFNSYVRNWVPIIFFSFHHVSLFFWTLEHSCVDLCLWKVISFSRSRKIQRNGPYHVNLKVDFMN